MVGFDCGYNIVALVICLIMPAKKKKKKKLSDDRFKTRLLELGSQAKMAREMGISQPAVSQRAKKLDIKLKKNIAKLDKGGGEAAMVVAQHLSGKTPDFANGMQEAGKKINTISQLTNFAEKIDSMVGIMEKEMSESKGKMRPYHIELMVKMIREGRGLVTSAHDIQKDLFDMRGVAAFIEAVVRVISQENPDAQKRLFLELSQLGYGQQSIIITENQNSRAE